MYVPYAANKPSLLTLLSQPRYNEIRNIPQRNTANDTTVKAPSVKKETKDTVSISGADLPGISTSKIDVNAKPIYEPVGKPITQVNIDEGELFKVLGLVYFSNIVQI